METKTFTEWLVWLKRQQIINAIKSSKNSWCVFNYSGELEFIKHS